MAYTLMLSMHFIVVWQLRVLVDVKDIHGVRRALGGNHFAILRHEASTIHLSIMTDARLVLYHSISFAVLPVVSTLHVVQLADPQIDLTLRQSMVTFTSR